ncbi:hypothetical protein LPB67_06115 [Undibacterium sp. Jales W-56]|uniref:bestrophin family protein n=1 Tax=Undibacterium sp. Jales W-56 TaxID=2897325 RepID=UPI0021D3760D|nr:bestrophin family ion channel [Undibacterium sp. Jales W-56]MCU6433353.1 hypothetical protein [Undibacterium sp. Jales W-56]
MIVRPQQNWFRLLFVWKGSVLQTIVPQLVFMFLVGLLALRTDGKVFGEKVPLNTIPFTLVGVALTIFLAFRNNASYDRYWESRKMWGNIVVSLRSLASQVICYLPADASEFDRLQFIRRLIAFAHALNHQLRKTDSSGPLSSYLPPEDAKSLSGKHFQPVAILHGMRSTLAEMQKAGHISDTRLWMMDAQLNELGAMVAGCERIASTPIPLAYGVLLHRTVYAYCVLLPFGLVDSIGIATPFISVFVSYTLIALEAIASDISEPFGKAPNNLALDAITRNIERSLLELCEQAIPEEMVVDSDYQLT